jgi:hypothetical protein
MLKNLDFYVAIGFITFCIGGLARTYMNITLDGWSSFVRSKGNTEKRYKQLMKEKGAPAWPLIVTVILMPLGIVIAFAAIGWSNHLRAR